MSRKKKFKVHGPPDRKHQPQSPTVPRDLIPPYLPRYTWNWSFKDRGKTQFLLIGVLAVVFGAVLMATKEAPWQVCLPLVIIIVVVGLLLYRFSKRP